MATMKVTMPARTATPRLIVESLDRGLDKRGRKHHHESRVQREQADVAEDGRVAEGERLDVLGHGRRQGAVVAVSPAAAAAVSWATSSSVLS